MKTRILHVLHSLQTGGLENGVVNLINRLDPERFEHAICCIATSGAMADRIIHPVEVIALGKEDGGDYLLPLKLVRVIRKIRPDIVHTRNWGTIDGIIAAHLAGVRYIIHGEHGREATDPTGANRRRLLARKLLHPLVTRFVAVSADIRQWLINDVGVSGDKVVQITNGVDTERFRPADGKATAKTTLGLAPGSFVIGSVGRLDPVKDYPTLIRAFAVFVTGRTGSTDLTNSTTLTGPPANWPTGKPVLLIVGSGPEETNLKKLAKELGIADAVYFTGERKDIPNVLQAMDIFVLPSIAEGISNTILEAMACGLPVVATEVGGNAELVSDGSSGALCGAGDHESVSRILASYYHDPATMRDHGKEGRKRTMERFSLEKMTMSYETLYASMS